MKYKVPNTLYHKIVNILAFIILVGLYIFLLIYWDSIPDKIPTHYNAIGEIDDWSRKSCIWIFPVVGFVVYAGMSVVESLPQAWSTVVQITEQNRDFVYQELKSMIITLKLVIMLTFTTLTVHQAFSLPLPSWFVFTELALIFGSIIFFIIRAVKSSRIGEEIT